MFLRCFSFFLIKKKRKKAILSKSNKFETRIDFCFFHKIQIEKNTGPEEREKEIEKKKEKKKTQNRFLREVKKGPLNLISWKKKLFEKKERISRKTSWGKEKVENSVTIPIKEIWD